MKIGIATDHNGVNEKRVLINFLQENGYEVVDFSPSNFDTDDYPDYASNVARAVVQGKVDEGILLCGTGIGMSIAANKIDGIRCAKISSIEDAFLAKSHNNANIIAMSYKEDIDKLKLMVNRYLETEFSNEERHIRRIDKITSLEGIDARISD